MISKIVFAVAFMIAIAPVNSRAQSVGSNPAVGATGSSASVDPTGIIAPNAVGSVANGRATNGAAAKVGTFSNPTTGSLNGRNINAPASVSGPSSRDFGYFGR